MQVKCLKTGSVITDANWNRQPVCDCKNCLEYFKKCREIGTPATNKLYSLEN